MPYATFNPQNHPEIEPFTRDIEELEPSGKYWISGLGAEQLVSLRYQLYNWLNTVGLKPFYKIQSFPGELLIIRKGLDQSVTTRFERPPLAPALEKLLTSALSANDPGAWVKSAQTKGTITTEEMGVVLDRLGRILE